MSEYIISWYYVYDKTSLNPICSPCLNGKNLNRTIQVALYMHHNSIPRGSSMVLGGAFSHFHAGHSPEKWEVWRGSRSSSRSPRRNHELKMVLQELTLDISRIYPGAAAASRNDCFLQIRLYRNCIKMSSICHQYVINDHFGSEWNIHFVIWQF